MPKQPKNGSVSVTEAVKGFQEWDGFIVTRKLDEDTLELMTLPRSGVLIQRSRGSLEQLSFYFYKQQR